MASAVMLIRSSNVDQMRASPAKTCCLGFLFLFLLPLWSIYFIREGAHGLQEARDFQHPIVLTFDQFEQTHPSEGWYRITNCFLDVPSAAYRQLTVGHSGSFSAVLKTYVPVRSISNPAETKIHVLVPSTDPDLTDTMEQLDKLGKSASGAEIQDWMTKNRNKLRIAKDIEGMVRTPDRLLPGDQEGIEVLKADLAPEYVVIEHGVTPTTTEPKVWLGLGLFLVVAQALFWTLTLRRQWKNKAGVPSTGSNA